MALERAVDSIVVLVVQLLVALIRIVVVVLLPTTIPAVDFSLISTARRQSRFSLTAHLPGPGAKLLSDN